MYMKISKFLLSFIIFLGVFLFLQPQQIFAQSCTGSTSGCQSTLQQCVTLQGTYDPNTGNPYVTCQATTQTDQAALCITSAQLTCSGCVANDQICYDPVNETSCYNGFCNVCDPNIQPCGYCAVAESTNTNKGCGDVILKACNTGCTIACNICSAGWSQCGGGPQPYNTCGTTRGSQSCNYDQLSTGNGCSAWTANQSCNQPYDECDKNAGYTCGDSSLCRATRSGKITNSETGAGISGVTVSSYTSGNISATTDNNGNYTLPASSTNGFAWNVQYTITAQNSGSVCTNYLCNSSNPKSSNPSTITFTTGGSGDCGSNCNFTFTPYHTITGEIYMDNNQNTCLDTGESGINFAANVTFTGPTTKTVAVNTTNGTFTSGNVLAPGVYTVSVSSTLPTGDRFKTAKSYQVTVGTSCSVANATTAKCQALNDTQPVCTTDGTNNVNNVVFGITDENATSGGMCADVRDDVTGGQYYNPIPATGYACGGVSGAYADFANGSCNNGAGIMFSCDGTFNFGSGQASAVNWQTDSTNPECFKPVNPHIIRTSYSYLESVAQSSNITPTDLSTICNISNCTLPSSGGYTTLPKGVYQVNGDLYLNATNFPANADPTKAPFNWIFLVNGNMYIQGNILVTPGSVVAFSVGANTTDVNKAIKGNIYVDPCVGQTLGSYSDTQATSANNTNIQGLYSADQNFVIESFTQVPGVCNQPATNTCNSDGTPVDKKLNILGSIVANAGQYATPGQVENQRDLCVFDKECPTYYYTPDPAELLNATLFLTHPLYSQHEVAP